MNENQKDAIGRPLDEIVIAFCDDCRYLSLTEEKQDQERTIGIGISPHLCNYYDRLLTHNGYHPRIPRLKECSAYFRR